MNKYAFLTPKAPLFRFAPSPKDDILSWPFRNVALKTTPATSRMHRQGKWLRNLTGHEPVCGQIHGDSRWRVFPAKPGSSIWSLFRALGIVVCPFQILSGKTISGNLDLA